MADVASERALLGSVFIDNHAWDKVALVPKEGWSLESHLRIRMGMKRLVSAGAVITVNALAVSLAARNELDVIGGKQYLVSLREQATQRPSADASDYVMPDDAPEPPPTREPATSSARGTHSGRQKIPDLTLDQGMPCNVEAERTILGAILLDNAAHAEAAEKLKSEDFSLDSHRRIFLRMTELMNAERAVDIVTLANELNRYKEVESIGGVAYLASLTEGLPRRPVIEEYIRITRDKSLLRQTMGICSMAIARAADQSESALEVLSVLQKKLEEIAAPVANSQQAPVQSFILGVIDEVARDYREKVQPAIPSGNAWFDEKTGGGYRMGKYTIVAARPKIGKTGFAVTSTAFNCPRGIHVTWQSLEMEKKEILLNLVPYVIDLPNIVCVRPWLRTPDQQNAVMNALAEIGDWPLDIYDGEMDCDQICWSIDRDAKKHTKILFILDHFGLIAGGDRDIRKRYVEHSERLRKKIKQHRNAALLCLFQLNEVPREFADKRPQRSDIGESKKPLQDCFAAAFLHRYQDKETLKMTTKANINLELIRGGGSPGNIDCEFDTKRLAFMAQAEFEYDNQANDWHQ
jgi:replicative DNA helicase